MINVILLPFVSQWDCFWSTCYAQFFVIMISLSSIIIFPPPFFVPPTSMDVHLLLYGAFLYLMLVVTFLILSLILSYFFWLLNCFPFYVSNHFYFSILIAHLSHSLVVVWVAPNCRLTFILDCRLNFCTPPIRPIAFPLVQCASTFLTSFKGVMALSGTQRLFLYSLHYQLDWACIPHWTRVLHHSLWTVYYLLFTLFSFPVLPSGSATLCLIRGPTRLFLQHIPNCFCTFLYVLLR